MRYLLAMFVVLVLCELACDNPNSPQSKDCSTERFIVDFAVEMSDDDIELLQRIVASTGPRSAIGQTHTHL